MAQAANLRDEAMCELISSLSTLQATAPTWCAGWSAHELTAHVAAAAEERANLIEDHLAGKPSRATRSWEVREPPFRALPALAEARRWRDADVSSRQVILRTGAGPDIFVTPGEAPSALGNGNGNGVVIELRPHELPLLLWGRCPARLRDPNANAERLEDVLGRLCGQAVA
ncbi:hypothetical protein A5712_25310 [Mycobacterium sp. E2327]|uniref:maleylpyruvate isomerase N-terminal domain-containing protein n=1 Tax=Mycobacterium sp. E2327 TaxID=1834132 RepID=UPI00080124AD|nr:maleylpyruvate isomerase N-terminal domain-containing protein [Mycobacterium sp. E2327]OBI16671.1 hypothetical protein A5712_25310 [Mycobacterium sp. E2327]